ncbi:8-oxo-dGTP diphosphatase [Glycomyces sambucus]|uniref:8-oxo-dGTP diphosphatase n=1 Tax=Glycomyces sambucus TaxID=380244 RepID=A0A1G9LVW1_9ACTN|nr:NUDIX domain-containing protein [Glycomyces sambucus]SDL66099.1 8-oxo-dGTP diphosphatase [Glycomyces sambucus]
MDDQLIDKLTAQAAEDGIIQLVVGAVITDEEDRVLLLKRPADDFMGGLWELPSGKVDPGERLDTALAREVKEETGLDLTEITTYLGHFDYTSGSGKPTRQFNFAITTTAVEPIKLTEHDKHQWLTISDNLPVSDAVKLILRGYASWAS